MLLVLIHLPKKQKLIGLIETRLENWISIMLGNS